VLDVERWAELRREHFVRGVSIKELMRRTGLARNTIRGRRVCSRPRRTMQTSAYLDLGRREGEYRLPDDRRIQHRLRRSKVTRRLAYRTGIPITLSTRAERAERPRSPRSGKVTERAACRWWLRVHNRSLLYKLTAQSNG
jgi:hypothetical protein